MVVATVIAIAARLDLVGFLALYAAVYTAGAVGLAIAAVRGPIRAAAHPGVTQPVNAVRVSITR